MTWSMVWLYIVWCVYWQYLMSILERLIVMSNSVHWVYMISIILIHETVDVMMYYSIQWWLIAWCDEYTWDDMTNGL